MPVVAMITLDKHNHNSESTGPTDWTNVIQLASYIPDLFIMSCNPFRVEFVSLGSVEWNR